MWGTTMGHLSSIAHVAGAGVLSDLIYVAIPCFVIGLILFRESWKIAVGVLALAVVLGGIGAYDVWRSRPRPSKGITLQVITPRSGDFVSAGKPFPVNVQVIGLTLSPVSTAVNRPGEGHLHTYVDGNLYSMWSKNGNDDLLTLGPGPHKVRIEVTTNDHRPLSPPVDDILDLTAR
jgi:hypothetical protein